MQNTDRNNNNNKIPPNKINCILRLVITVAMDITQAKEISLKFKGISLHCLFQIKYNK